MAYLQTLPEAPREARLLASFGPVIIVGIGQLLLLRRQVEISAAAWLGLTFAAAFVGLMAYGVLFERVSDSSTTTVAMWLLPVYLGVVLGLGQALVLRRTYRGVVAWIGASSLAPFLGSLANSLWPGADIGPSSQTALLFAVTGGAVKGGLFGVFVLFMQPKRSPHPSEPRPQAAQSDAPSADETVNDDVDRTGDEP
ncbi:MAG TPA: hypothetical protein VG389_14235 [Myxococcota bacterium]|jgi:hypothetical protein|nr:hypothetical protein [Myxococcota bacterium]